MVRTMPLLFAALTFSPIQAHALGSSMQLRGRANQVHRGAIDLSSGEETCADLNNQGAYFSVKVRIGTPVKDTEPQEFELVADTGSDSVIVTSCLCVKNQYCDPNDKCFRGTNRSSSFNIQEVPQKFGNKTTKAPMGLAMTFGSGTVMTVIATDKVSVAGQDVKMNDGLLLMVDRRMLNIQGEFQGILGLGPPDRTNTSSKAYRDRKHEEVMEAKDAKSEAGDPKEKSDESKSGKSHASGGSDAARHAEGDDYAPKLFLQKAGVERYTLCFNDAGNPGAIRVNVPEFRQPLPTVGQFHWGLGLHGISIGDENGESLVCHDKNMKKGQVTPCGVIPDSGTTLLMGPEDHIMKMFSGLCDKWDRCKKARDDKDSEYHNMTRGHAFQKLLYNCADWKSKDKGINEVPSVFFNVGEAGNTQKLELSAWSYIVETEEEVMAYRKKYLFGIIPVQVPSPSGVWRKVCAPNFGVQEYNTDANGPVWIMGHPLFYQYRVGYSLGAFSKSNSLQPMKMAFEKGTCGTCSGNNPSLLSSQSELHTTGEHARPMRYSPDPPTVRQYDVSLPL